MHLRQMKQKNGRVKLAIYESYREGRRTRAYTVKSLGYVDELICEHDDPVAWGKELALQMTKEKNASEQAVPVDIYPMQKIDMHSINEKNLGSAIALTQYAALGIKTALMNFRASQKKRAKYSLNSICRALVCERIVSLGSKLAACENKERYFFKTDFSQNDVYRSLEDLAKAKDTVISAMNRAIQKAGIRNFDAVYYDVTNYYFEIDKEDDLRKKGVSKQHQKTPLVQMGLLQDANGIPVSYRIFPGNTPDCQTMIPVLEDLKRDNNLNRVIVVADKGLNCSQNIAACVAKGDGFIFSQSIRGTKSGSSIRKWVLDKSGYDVHEGYKIKSIQGSKTVHLKAEDCDNGKAQDVKVDVKYVAKWSAKYEARAKKKRAQAIEKARQLIKNPEAYSSATSYGAAKYVENLHFDKESGEIVTGFKLRLNEKAIKEDEALDGYYLIVTSETNLSDEKINDAYHELWRIEETFKITKTEIETRPVYVRKKDHIEAHFLTCYIALVILRLLQLETGLNATVIAKEISAMNCVNINANWWVCGHRTEESDTLVDYLGLQDLKRKNLRTIDAKKILTKAFKGKIVHKEE